MKPLTIFKLVMMYLLAVLFIGAGVNHFWHVDFYLGIMPPYLPWPRELVYLSGACEVALGVLLVIPRCTPLAAWALIALLLAVFPANIHMAIHSDDYNEYSPTLLWLRLPLQGVLIAWAYWYTALPRRGSPQ
jgi:uncharacterized membrane protein